MTQPNIVLRPCIQGGLCHGCTDACVELNPCPECGAGRNEPCKREVPSAILVEFAESGEQIIVLY